MKIMKKRRNLPKPVRDILLAPFACAVMIFAGVTAVRADIDHPPVSGLDRGPSFPSFRADDEDTFNALVESIYKRIEVYSQSADPVVVKLSDLRTYDLETAAGLPFRDVGTLPNGRRLRLDRDAYAPTVEDPLSVVYRYRWEDYPAKVDVIGQQQLLLSASLGSILEEVRFHLPAFHHVEYVTLFRARVAVLGQERDYRAAMFWARARQADHWYAIPHDRILGGVAQVIQEAGEPRTLEDAARLDRLRGAPTALDSSSTGGMCEATSSTTPFERRKEGRVSHESGSNGAHVSRFKGDFSCECSDTCASTCSFQSTQVTCTDIGPLVQSKLGHDMSYEVDSSWQVKRNAVNGSGATCEAALACAMVECFNGVCGEVTVSVSVLGASASASVNGATWNGSLAGQVICEACTLKEDPCLRASVGGTDQVDCGGGDDTQPCLNCSPTTPILISLHDQKFELTSLEGGVEFDIDANFRSGPVSWTAPDSDEAFLVYDRNANGVIDAGWELFGSVTTQPDTDEPNGYYALALFDAGSHGGNEDSIISEEDWIYRHLRLWRDADHDGVSQAHELLTLPEAGVTALDLDTVVSNKRDRFGNVYRWRSKVLFADGAWKLAAADVILQVD